MILTHELLVKSIPLFGEGHKGIKKFPDKLLLDLKFSLPRRNVRKILGNPKEIGGAGESFLYKEDPNWDKYLFSDYSLHFLEAFLYGQQVSYSPPCVRYIYYLLLKALNCIASWIGRISFAIILLTSLAPSLEK